MAYYIKEEEKIHIITEMSTKKMAWELAQMFYSREEFTSDDLFYLRFQCPYKFYLEVFKHLYFLTIKKLDSGKIDDVLMNVFTKIYIDYYPNKTDKNDFVDPNYLVSRFLESVLVYVMKEYSNYNIVCQIITTVVSGNSVDSSVIKEIIIRNRELLTLDIIRDVVRSEILSSSDIIDILVEMHKYFDNDTIDEIISDIYFNKELLLKFTRAVMARFKISLDEIYERNGNIKAKEVIFPKYKNKNEKELLIHLREFLTDIIYSSAEIEMFEFLNKALQGYLESGNIYLSDIFKDYIHWFSSSEREKVRSKNFYKYGYEEGEVFSIDTINELAMDIFTKAYIIEIDKLSEFDIFLRVFNVNRFLIFQFKNYIPVAYRIDFAYDYSSWYIDNGLDMDMYLFLNPKK